MIKFPMVKIPSSLPSGRFPPQTPIGPKAKSTVTIEASTGATASGSRETSNVFREAAARSRVPASLKKDISGKLALISKVQTYSVAHPPKVKPQKVEGLSIKPRPAPRRFVGGMSEELRANLKLATKVAGEVSLMVPRSANAVESGRVYHGGPIFRLADGKLAQSQLYPHLADRANYAAQRAMVETTSKTWTEYFEKTELECKKSGMGNCTELAAIACKRLQEAGARQVELVSIGDGSTVNCLAPHAVAVLGRSDYGKHPELSIDARRFPGSLGAILGSEIGTPDDWNENAVICDPWARIAYPARDFPDYWDVLRTHNAQPEKLGCFLLHRLDEGSP